MEMAKLLEMRSVARLVQVEDDNNEARAIVVAANAAGRLDIFGRRFRLALYDHQSETQDVEAN